MATPTDEQIADAVKYAAGLVMPPIVRRRLFKKLYDVGDQAVWKKYGFESIYLHQMQKQDWSGLGRILNHPVMRVALDCCLITGLTHDEIIQLLPAIYFLPISLQDIANYTTYFFDYSNLNKSDWQAFLNQISEDRYTHNRIMFALTRPQEEVLHAVGLPSRLHFGTMLKNVMNTANYRFEYYARQQSPEAQDEARKWARLMMEAGAKHEKFGSTDATDFSKLIQTQFEYIENDVPNITPEMLADAKPAPEAHVKAIEERLPPPPSDTSDNPGGRNDL